MDKPLLAVLTPLTLAALIGLSGARPARSETARLEAFEAQAWAASLGAAGALEGFSLKSRNEGEDSGAQALGIDGKDELPNFAEIGSGLWRSGQPNRAGLAQLKAKGIKTLLYLREDAGKDEKAEAQRLGMRMERVSMSALHAPRFGEVDRALALMKDESKRPLVVHCRHGKDRTGFTVAAYRVTVEGWSIEEAVREAKARHCCAFTFRDLDGWLGKYKARVERLRPAR